MEVLAKLFLDQFHTGEWLRLRSNFAELLRDVDRRPPQITFQVRGDLLGFGSLGRSRPITIHRCRLLDLTLNCHGVVWCRVGLTCNMQIFLRHMRNLMQLLVSASEWTQELGFQTIIQETHNTFLLLFSPFLVRISCTIDSILMHFITSDCILFINKSDLIVSRLAGPDMWFLLQAKDWGLREKWAIRDTSFKSQEAMTVYLSRSAFRAKSKSLTGGRVSAALQVECGWRQGYVASFWERRLREDHKMQQSVSIFSMLRSLINICDQYILIYFMWSWHVL